MARKDKGAGAVPCGRSRKGARLQATRVLWSRLAACIITSANMISTQHHLNFSLLVLQPDVASTCHVEEKNCLAEMTVSRFCWGAG